MRMQSSSMNFLLRKCQCFQFILQKQIKEIKQTISNHPTQPATPKTYKCTHYTHSTFNTQPQLWRQKVYIHQILTLTNNKKNHLSSLISLPSVALRIFIHSHPSLDFIHSIFMLTLKKFLFCIRLETGCVLISAYCSLTDVAYITALVQLYQFVRITKQDKDMNVVDKLKALGISACVNFMIYHTIASLLLSIGVRKVSVTCV